ncbi:MAG: glycosyltransferase [Cyanobacteria bacterium J06638_28]
MGSATFPKLYFYIKHYRKLPKEILPDAEKFHNTRPYEVTDGENAWLLKTWQYLNQIGVACELVDYIPDSGILFYTYENFPYNQKPNKNLLLVYVKGDKPPHPYANLMVIQSTYEKLNYPKSHFIPLWPQPGLKPRTAERGDRFENIAYLGTHGSLTDDLKTPEWQEKVAALGLNWTIRSQPEAWSEYTDIDAVLAVRSFATRVEGQYTKDQGKWKPATKLYNSWLAGVVPILGNEPAFRELRKSELDYLEVNSLEEALETLIRLRDDPQLRETILDNARRRCHEFSVNGIAQQWSDFIHQTAIPTWQTWHQNSPIQRQLFLLKKEGEMNLYHYKNQLTSKLLKS